MTETIRSGKKGPVIKASGINDANIEIKLTEKLFIHLLINFHYL